MEKVKLYVLRETLKNAMKPFGICRNDEKLTGNEEYDVVCEMDSWDEVANLDADSLLSAFKHKMIDKVGVKVKEKVLEQVMEKVEEKIEELSFDALVKTIETKIKKETEKETEEEANLSLQEVRSRIEAKGGKLHPKAGLAKALEILNSLG